MFPPPSLPRLKLQAKRTVKLLHLRQERLVLAESCSGGALAALLTEVPDVSKAFCGSQVVYRERSKRAWLGVSAADLKRHSAVSREVSEAMVRGILRRTPEATIAGAITGYLGPSGNDVGLVFLSVIRRGERTPTTLKIRIGAVAGSPERARAARRAILVGKFFEVLIALLNSHPRTGNRARLFTVR